MTDKLGHLVARPDQADGEQGQVADVRTSVIYEHLRNHAVAPAAGP